MSIIKFPILSTEDVLIDGKSVKQSLDTKLDVS
jgi:hypothetical protein